MSADKPTRFTTIWEGTSVNIYTKPVTVNPTANQGRDIRANKRTRPLAGPPRDYGLLPVGTNNVVYESFRPVLGGTSYARG